MGHKVAVSDYHSNEEWLNAVIHGFGAILAFCMCVLMVVKVHASGYGPLQVWGIVVYGVSLFLVFLSSTLYHCFSNTAAKIKLKRLDHCAIYLLIAGTYTPFLLISLQTTKAYGLLALLWGLVVVGICFKLVFIHRFHRISVITYMLMGWLAVFILGDLHQVLDGEAFRLLIIGGALYTIGALFYVAKKYSYTHAIWHTFVLFAAFCHVAVVYVFVI